MNPTIDITAAVRPYAKRLASHADGSGNISINHSWNTGGNLRRNQVSLSIGLSRAFRKDLHREDLSAEYFCRLFI